MSVKYLSLSTLLQSDRSFDLFVDGAAPSAQLVANGFHSPLPVIINGTGEVTLIWGWRILDLARDLALAAVPTLECAGPASDALLTALSLEGRTGKYSFPERAAIYRLAQRNGLSDSDLEVVGRAVTGDGSFVTTIARYSELPQSLRPLVDSGMVDLKTAEYVARLPDSVLSAATTAERFATLSFSTRRVALRLLWDLFCREPEQAASYATDAFRSSTPERYLAVLRYPERARMERRFGQLRDEIWRETGFRIEAPEYFEGGSFQLRCSFSTSEELAARRRGLSFIEEQCDELFGFLR